MGSDDPTLQEYEQVPDSFEDPNHHAAIAFRYYSDAYGAFLSGTDDFTEQKDELKARYGT